MRVYTFSQARQQLAALLVQARRDGQVRIRRRDGQEFVVRPAPAAEGSPLDVPGLDIGLKPDDLVSVLRESRQSTERFLPSALRPRKCSTRRPKK